MQFRLLFTYIIINQVKEALAEEGVEDEAKMFEEIRKVGGFANETIIDGVKEVEILLQMKDPPKLEMLEEIKVKLVEKLGAEYTFESHNETAIITGIPFNNVWRSQIK